MPIIHKSPQAVEQIQFDQVPAYKCYKVIQAKDISIMLESPEVSKIFSRPRVHIEAGQINRLRMMEDSIKVMMTIFGIRALPVQMVPQVREVLANNNLIKAMVVEIGYIENLN